MKTKEHTEKSNQAIEKPKPSTKSRGGGYEGCPDGPFASGKGATAKRKEEDEGREGARPR